MEIVIPRTQDDEMFLEVSSISLIQEQRAEPEEPVGVTRPRAISRICDKFIESEEDAEEIEFLLSLLRDRRTSGNSTAPSTADTDLSLHRHLPCADASGPLPLLCLPLPPQGGLAGPGTSYCEAPSLLRKRFDPPAASHEERYRLGLKRLKLRSRGRALSDIGGAPPFLVASWGRCAFETRL